MEELGKIQRESRAILDKLPVFSARELKKAEDTHENYCRKPDIHHNGDNMSAGEELPLHLQKSYDRIDDCFRRNGSVVTQSDVFVFRGVALWENQPLIIESNRVIFATWLLDKAIYYANYNHDGRGPRILLAIRLKKGTPIITTDWSNEILLPFTYKFELRDQTNLPTELPLQGIHIMWFDYVLDTDKKYIYDDKRDYDYGPGFYEKWIQQEQDEFYENAIKRTEMIKEQSAKEFDEMTKLYARDERYRRDPRKRSV
jgi:hypothetical protein